MGLDLEGEYLNALGTLFFLAPRVEAEAGTSSICRRMQVLPLDWNKQVSSQGCPYARSIDGNSAPHFRSIDDATVSSERDDRCKEWHLNFLKMRTEQFIVGCVGRLGAMPLEEPSELPRFVFPAVTLCLAQALLRCIYVFFSPWIRGLSESVPLSYYLHRR